MPTQSLLSIADSVSIVFHSPTHVESIQEPLNIPTHHIPSNLLLPLEHTLRDSRHGRVMPLFDTLKELSEFVIVLVYFWWVGKVGGRWREIPKTRTYG